MGWPLKVVGSLQSLAFELRAADLKLRGNGDYFCTERNRTQSTAHASLYDSRKEGWNRNREEARSAERSEF